MLHRRTSLLIHSKCNSLHSPLPNSRYWFLNIIVLSIPTTYMRRLCSFVEEPLLWSILVPKRYFPAMANSVIARVQDHSCTNFLQHKRQTKPSQIRFSSFDDLRGLQNLLLTGTSLWTSLLNSAYHCFLGKYISFHKDPGPCWKGRGIFSSEIRGKS